MVLNQLLVVFLISIARSSDALRAVPTNNATAEGPSHSPAPKVNMQFVQRAAFSELWFDPTNPAAPGTLTLKGISPHTTFYSTSPVRTAGIFATQSFMTQPKFYTTSQNASQWLGAPNAALISGSEGPYLSDEVIILTITSASYNKTMDTMIYQVSLVMDNTGLSMASAGAGDTGMGRGMSRSAEWLMGKQPSQAAANRVEAATAAQEQSYGSEQVDPVLRRVDVALHIGPWEVEDMPR